MRSMAYSDIGQLELVESDVPSIGPNDVLLRVEACGICGSDVASYLHGHYVERGQVLGHEISATVAAMGEAVTGLKLKSRVAVRPSRSCGHCPYCLANKPYLCGESRARTLGYGEPGGYADFVVMRDVRVGADVVPVPENMSAVETLWAEPLAVAVHAVAHAAPGPDRRLLVVGVGSVGLCAVAAALAIDAGEVVVIEPRSDRREAASTLGARAVAPGELTTEVFESIIDTSGSAPAINAAAQHLEVGGNLVLVGLGDKPLPWPMPAAQITGSFAYSDDDFRLAVDHLATGRVELGRFVSHRYALSNTGEAIAASAEDPTIIKAAIFPSLRVPSPIEQNG